MNQGLPLSGNWGKAAKHIKRVFLNTRWSLSSCLPLFFLLYWDLPSGLDWPLPFFRKGTDDVLGVDESDLTFAAKLVLAAQEGIAPLVPVLWFWNAPFGYEFLLKLGAFTQNFTQGHWPSWSWPRSGQHRWVCLDHLFCRSHNLEQFHCSKARAGHCESISIGLKAELSRALLPGNLGCVPAISQVLNSDIVLRPQPVLDQLLQWCAKFIDTILECHWYFSWWYLRVIRFRCSHPWWGWEGFKFVHSRDQKRLSQNGSAILAVNVCTHNPCKCKHSKF